MNGIYQRGGEFNDNNNQKIGTVTVRNKIQLSDFFMTLFESISW